MKLNWWTTRCLLFAGVLFSSQGAFGAGNPILLVTTTSNKFTSYYPEILRAEGLNASDTADIATVSAATLAAYDIAILGEMPLTTAQVTIFTNWVNAGGNLIVMRPDKQLSSLLGLTDAASTLSDAYLLVNTTSPPGVGIVGQTIQFHGSADQYLLSGATTLATLYSTATAATAYPAVTLRTGIGTGGRAAAFTYDLARSVIYTRQGNPAWAGQARIGQGGPIRAGDMFYGGASFDPKPDWVDLNKVAIPQADEQQRLLVNLILNMNQAKKPIPRFWYFPFGKKAAVIMTGDDHAVGGTAGRFDDFIAASPTGCSVTNWECIRATSYVFPSSPLTNSQASTYNIQGFEVAAHINTNCADYTPSQLANFYTSELNTFANEFPSIPAPQSNRTHCIAWNDWATEAQLELTHGIRLDTNYYYWPASWIQNRPGMFTGSGMPMRFAQTDGTLIDVYQAVTQMPDESGQVFPFFIDTLLDNAVGAAGFYGAFTANMHTDYNNCGTTCPDGNTSELSALQIVASAKARGVPVVSAKQMLQWLDGRNGSSFGSFSWTGNNLAFTITAAASATGLQAMLPTASPLGTLSAINKGGTPVLYTVQTIKGVDYAFFPAISGGYQATYGGLAITAVSATPGSNTATITWTTNFSSNSRVEYGTSSTSLTSVVTNATFTTSHSVILPGLTSPTTYYFRVISVDGSSNSATSPVTSFTTIDPTPPVNTVVAALPGAGGTATITWTTNKLATSRVDFGTVSSSLGSTQSDGAMVTSHSVVLSGLTNGTTYYYRVTSTDGLGNSSTSPVTSGAPASFVEVASISVWNSSTTPEVLDSADSTAVEVGMKIRSDVSGIVTGVRFYKIAANAGIHIGNLWSSTGTLLGTVTFNNETVSGWQQATFLTPVSIVANTTYVVSYFAPNGHYSVTDGFFSSGGAATPPLRALASGIDGLNGTYRYGSSSGFPTSSFDDSNYWVDLTFLPGDVTAPVVTSFSIPATATTLTVAVTSFTATDNTSVAAYLITESAATPLASAVGWSATAPTSFTFTTGGSKTLYAWAKDAAGNVSVSRSATVFVAGSSNTPETSGWYSGDMHVHRSCGGTPDALASIYSGMNPENLAVISLLADMGNGEVQNATTDLPLVNGVDASISTPGRIVHWDTEWHWDPTFSQYPHQALGGHVVALGLSQAQQVWQESTYQIFDWAHQRNGIAGFAHMQYLDGSIPQSLSCCTPIEYPVEVALGSADFISEDVDDIGSAYSMNPEAATQAYYKLLNTGFRPGLAAGTDYPCNGSRPLGSLLTYAQVAGGQMTYRNWIEAIRNGRTVISRNGHREFLSLTVNGTATPGDEIQLAAGGTLPVSVQWNATESLSGSIEVVSNGVVVASQVATVAAGSPATFNTTVNFPRSGWVAVRRMGSDGHQVHTAAVFVIVNNAPIRASVDDAQFYVQWMDNLLTKTAPGGPWNSYFPTNLAPAQARYQAAKSVYQQIALDAGVAITPVVISAVSATPATTTATITWTTNKNSTSRVDVGTAPGSLAAGVPNETMVTSHSMNLTGLALGTTYYFRVVSVDAFGNSATSPDTAGVPASFVTVDNNPPVITAVTAVPGTGGIATITWTTNKLSNSRVDFGTVSTSLGSNQLNGTMVTTHSITLTGLTNGTTYFYRVTSADTLGNTATSPVITGSPASFIEVAGISVWNSSTVPGTVDSADSGGVELGMKFRSDVAGVVTGVRFYKAAANTGVHVGNLWSSTGTLLGTVNFSNETASGWQQVNFSTPVSIAANTTYIVSYFTPVGRYSVNNPFFTSTGVDNVPLHALASGVDGLNGTFRYGSTSGFPNSSFNNSNYWVDLVFLDNIAPTISAVAAAPAATGATITWTTNEASNSRVDYGTSAALGQSVTNASMLTAHSVTLTGLTTGTPYFYRVVSVDSFGNSTTSPIGTSAPLTFTPTDTTPPVISAVSATPATTTATITWTTDKTSTSRVDLGTAPGSLATGVPNATLVTSHSMNLTGLAVGTTYYFRVVSVDALGNSATSPAITGSPATFTTIDSNPPVITAVTALAGAGGTATITWTTNKLSNSRVDFGTVSTSLGSNQLNGTMVTTHSITLTGLTNGTTYFYRVTSADTLGNTATSPVITGSPASFIEVAGISVWNSSTVPGTVDSADSGGVELGMKFRSDVAGVVTGVRFYKAAANTGVHVGNLWSSTGTLLGTVNFSNETASGWQQVNFSTPVSIAANTTYIVSYFTPVGRYSVNNPFFTSTGVDNVPLHALASGVDGLNGTFRYGSTSGFPNSSFNNSNYWVDLVFLDNIAPTISAVAAAPTPTGATITWTTNEASNSRVDYGTSAALGQSVTNASMLTAHSVTLTGLTTGTTYFYRVVSVDSFGNSTTSPIGTSAPLTFTAANSPLGISGISAAAGLAGTATIRWTTDRASSSLIQYGIAAATLNQSQSNATLVTAHTITLTGLTQGVTYFYRVTSVDSAGVSATSPATPNSPASFVENAISVWSSSTVPGIVDSADTGAVQLGMKVRSDVAGSISGIRFYKAAANTGTHIGNLWTSTGTLLATVTFTNETASGWQQANFTTPIAINANTTYVISYYTPTGHYSVNANAFTSAGVNNLPLRALATGVDGSNGVFLYGSSTGFPTLSWTDSNYWVDVVFSAQ